MLSFRVNELLKDAFLILLSVVEEMLEFLSVHILNHYWTGFFSSEVITGDYAGLGALAEEGGFDLDVCQLIFGFPFYSALLISKISGTGLLMLIYYCIRNAKTSISRVILGFESEVVEKII